MDTKFYILDSVVKLDELEMEKNCFVKKYIEGDELTQFLVSEANRVNTAVSISSDEAVLAAVVETEVGTVEMETSSCDNSLNTVDNGTDASTTASIEGLFDSDNYYPSILLSLKHAQDLS